MTRGIEQRLMTAQELYGLPDDGLRHELIAGQLLSEPPAGFEHGTVGSKIVHLLAEFVRPRGLGAVCGPDTGFFLAQSPDTVRCPDVSFVSRNRIPPAERRKDFFAGAPDLAVEVLSPGDRPGEVRAKVAEYLAAGSRAVWVVDPKSGTVTVYWSLFAPRRLGPEDLLDGEPVLPEFSVRVSELFDL